MVLTAIPTSAEASTSTSPSHESEQDSFTAIPTSTESFANTSTSPTSSQNIFAAILAMAKSFTGTPSKHESSKDSSIANPTSAEHSTGTSTNRATNIAQVFAAQSLESCSSKTATPGSSGSEFTSAEDSTGHDDPQNASLDSGKVILTTSANGGHALNNEDDVCLIPSYPQYHLAIVTLVAAVLSFCMKRSCKIIDHRRRYIALASTSISVFAIYYALPFLLDESHGPQVGFLWLVLIFCQDANFRHYICQGCKGWPDLVLESR